MRVGAVLLGLGFVVAGCGSSTATCDVETLVDHDLAAFPAAVDCGAAPDAGDPSAAAQACVLSALAAGSAFKLVYRVPDPTSDLRAAFTGLPQAGGRVAVHAFAFSGDRPGVAGDAHATISFHTCESDGTTPALTATPSCTPSPGHPCLSCTHAGAGSILCGEQL